MRVLSRIGLGLLVLLLLGGAYLYHQFGSEPVPAETDYDVGLDALRRLARSGDGALPIEIRFENIADGAMPRAAILARASFEPTDMPRPVFQVVYPDGRYVLVDAAYDRAAHEQMPGPGGGRFHDDAWQSLVRAMEGASQIVVTHEHPDHLGGVAAHPRPERIADRVRLNVEQADAPRSVDTVLPSAITRARAPLDYADALAIAPGVVLKRAPGHTPGTQMVFVALADGRELLFVGDVVWKLEAIERLVYRPRLVTNWLLGEDRGAVLDQIRALRRLLDAREVKLVVSHDDRTFRDGSMIEGFLLP